jgi:nitrate/TMAO reductase-like tetraheme cytochrome c subunit
MKKFFSKVHDFFFPPAGASRATRLLPYGLLGLLTLLVLIGGAYGWDYTNSPRFCGETCHTMPPEYTAYQVSPHARITCTECHIGRDFIATQITRKAGDLRHVVFTIFKKYEFPITADDMRPARETCEKCHSPTKFSDDSLQDMKEYKSDVPNTPQDIYLILKTGGGTKREGAGKGIHWHIENRILYYAPDRARQEIPYVRVFNDDGSVTEYVDVESGFSPATIQESDLEEMDCITCHNRITHLVEQPEVAVDNAISHNLIDASIPSIRTKAVEALRASYTSQPEAMKGIEGIENYYSTYYADYYAENEVKITAAIKVVQDIYNQLVYLEQKSDWNTHPNNVGHLYSPGCFRCHDGKHLDANNQAIRLECNLCHSIPVVAGNQDFIANIEISRGPEPETHRSPNWIVMHRQVFDSSCSNCHNTKNPGGTDNTSFCSNSACHGSAWTYAGFDAPKLREIIQAQLPTPAPEPALGEGPLTFADTIGPLFKSRCTSCHGTNGVQGLDLTTLEGVLKGGQSGAAIVPGDPDASLLIQKQSGETPHFSQLNASELELVKKWIEAGAP